MIYVKNLHESDAYSEKLHKQQMKYVVWIEVGKLKTHPTLLVPGWTGFDITVRNEVVVVESLVLYLDTVDSPATDLKTAYEVLCRGCEIRERLKLCAVACIFNEAFYAKAMEIHWKQKHVQKLHHNAWWIPSRFGDAGLHKVVIQSDVIAEGSIDSVLTGKNYNRAVCLHKIVYEVLMKLLVVKFEASLLNGAAEVILEKHSTAMEDFKLDICQQTSENILTGDEIRNQYNLFKTYIKDLKDSGSDLVKFRLSHLNLCELALNLIYDTRTSGCELYPGCLHTID